MTDNVIRMVPDSAGENYRLQASTVLEEAKKNDFERVVVLGWLENGELYVAGSANAGESLILIEQSKHFIVFGKDGRD